MHLIPTASTGRAYVWPLSVWDRLHAWLFAACSVLALVLVAHYLHDFSIEYSIWFLAPLSLYPPFILDALYIYRHDRRRAAATAFYLRVLCCVAAFAAAMTLCILLGVLSIVDGHATRAFRARQPAPFLTLLVLSGAMAVMALLHVVVMYLGAPTRETNLRAMQYFLVPGAALDRIAS